MGAGGKIKKIAAVGTAKEDPSSITERFQEELLIRATNTLSSLARVAIEVLGVEDLHSFALERKLNAALVTDVPGFVFSREVVKFVANSVSAKPSLVVSPLFPGFSLTSSPLDRVWWMLSVCALLAAALRNVRPEPAVAAVHRS